MSPRSIRSQRPQTISFLDYSRLQPILLDEQGDSSDVTDEDAEDVLSPLREDSGTGPERLPAIKSKHCAKELAKPVRMLTLLILATGVWPEMWLQHWAPPLFTRKNVYDPSNYQGIHLTAQLSKVVARLVKALLVPFATRTHLVMGPVNSLSQLVEVRAMRLGLFS